MNIAMDLIREALLGGSGGGGGGGDAVLVYKGEVECSTTSTTATLVKTVTPEESILDKDALVYIVIKDKAGKRNGYFYKYFYFGFCNQQANGNAGAPTYINCLMSINNNLYSMQTNSLYGIYPSVINSGDVQIYERYGANSSRTIDGTYVIEIYKMQLPDGVIFGT